MARALARAKIGAENIHVEDAAHALDVHIHQPRGRCYDTGVDYDAIEFAEFGCLFEHRDYLGFNGDIALYGLRLATGGGDGADDFFGRGSIANIVDADRPAPPAGEDCRRAADATTGPGNQNGLGHR